MKILLLKKNMLKIEEKAETIKKIKVSMLKKVFQICDDKFFSYEVINFQTIYF
jgi:hypothetical protein